MIIRREPPITEFSAESYKSFQKTRRVTAKQDFLRQSTIRFIYKKPT